MEDDKQDDIDATEAVKFCSKLFSIQAFHNAPVDIHIRVSDQGINILNLSCDYAQASSDAELELSLRSSEKDRNYFG